MSNKTNFQALLEQKCPRCRKGKTFKFPTFSTKFSEMHENCPHCDLKYEIELGFYWGAMYFSYAFSVALVVITGLITYFLLGNPDTIVYISIATISILLFTPMSYRYSRLLMLYLFSGVEYDEELSRNGKNKVS